MSCSRVTTSGSMVTLAVSVARLTFAGLTPGVFSRAREIVFAQFAHVIPVGFNATFAWSTILNMQNSEYCH